MPVPLVDSDIEDIATDLLRDVICRDQIVKLKSSAIFNLGDADQEAGSTIANLFASFLAEENDGLQNFIRQTHIEIGSGGKKVPRLAPKSPINIRIFFTYCQGIIAYVSLFIHHKIFVLIALDFA